MKESHHVMKKNVNLDDKKSQTNVKMTQKCKFK